jgi:hypothetical protein
MTDVGAATPDGPARRRESWSLKNLVEDIAGKPIGELQDPDRPMHPYLKVKGGGAPAPRRTLGLSAASAVYGAGPAHAVAEVEPVPDPVDRFYPPLVGETGRALHGPEHEHHAATLSAVAASRDESSPGQTHHAPGPSQRPERIYLHYLLLHMDRLNDHALRYLKHAVDEELRHRDAGSSEPPAPPIVPPPS